ncbi:hypothetical protein F383_03723 [Gossypium arboreum]|uniref:Uncharacterized protein n=1 Tax=Gossypium arboreum TaxID=29729 RepID=A0A0B0P098_GOSAR|nr:hypothetical protein F383_03723 [Gossypium arboreum]
MPLSHTGSYS